MRYGVMALLLVLGGLSIAAAAQSGTISSADANEMAGFRAFIVEHPRALALLKKRPWALQTAEFAEDFRSVGDYLAKHRRVKALVNNDPHFFDQLTADPRAGGGHKHRWWW